jgi:hypothetical protein
LVAKQESIDQAIKDKYEQMGDIEGYLCVKRTYLLTFFRPLLLFLILCPLSSFRTAIAGYAEAKLFWSYERQDFYTCANQVAHKEVIAAEYKEVRSEGLFPSLLFRSVFSSCFFPFP